MQLWSRFATSLLAALSLAAPGRSEGLVQLTLQGEVVFDGGALVELHVGFWKEGQVVPIDLRLHLGPKTSASDVGHLLVARLRQAGARVLFPGEGTPRSTLAEAFIEDVTLLSYRLEGGLSAIVTLCEQGPESVSFLPPLETERAGSVSICVSTFHPHTKKSGRITLRQELAAADNASSICQRLFETSLESGLVGDRPQGDRWRAVRAEDGSEVTGCSIKLDGKEADWGLVVRLSLPE